MLCLRKFQRKFNCQGFSDTFSGRALSGQHPADKCSRVIQCDCPVAHRHEQDFPAVAAAMKDDKWSQFHNNPRKLSFKFPSSAASNARGGEISAACQNNSAIFSAAA